MDTIERLVEDAIAIARIPAPTFHEEARIAWLEQRLAAASGRRHRDEVGNLIWEWGDGRPRLLLTAHVDTVFGPEVELEARREGDRLVGPGIGDNAIAIAIALSVTEELLALGDLDSGAVAFTVCEEGHGNLRGALAACHALEPETMIALEGHGLDRIFVEAVGSVRASVHVTGPGGHSWVDSGRPSAVHQLFDLGVQFTHLRRDGVTVNIGTVSGGRSVNTIADDGEMVIEVRSTDEDLLSELVEQITSITVDPPLAVDVTILGRRPAGRIASDAVLLAVVREVRESLGLADVLDAASTDANAGLACGIPSLALGAALGSEMHSTAEWIRYDSLQQGRSQLEQVMRRLLSADAAERHGADGAVPQLAEIAADGHTPRATRRRGGSS